MHHSDYKLNLSIELKLMCILYILFSILKCFPLSFQNENVTTLHSLFSHIYHWVIQILVTWAYTLSTFLIQQLYQWLPTTVIPHVTLGTVTKFISSTVFILNTCCFWRGRVLILQWWRMETNNKMWISKCMLKHHENLIPCSIYVYFSFLNEVWRNRSSEI
jgi:hypothetical protein